MWANALYLLVFGYIVSVVLETPVLLVGLSRPHSWRLRLAAGLWLTACTYPIVILVLPTMCRWLGLEEFYLLIAETFAPVAECLLFWAATSRLPLTSGQRVQDCVAIIVANLLSFLAGFFM